MAGADVLPRGEISLLGADGGTGKGHLAGTAHCLCDAGQDPAFRCRRQQTGKGAAACGRGRPRQGAQGRLLAAGADMNRVLVLTADDYFAKTGQPLTLRIRHWRILPPRPGRCCSSWTRCRAFCPPMWRWQAATRCAVPCCRCALIAAKQGCAVLIVMHSNKKQGVSDRTRLADSSDIWDMARSVLMMGRCKNSTGGPDLPQPREE